MLTTKSCLPFLLLLLIVPYNSGQPSPNPYASSNFNPSMAIIVVVLVSAFFFMGFFSVYIRQCTGDRSVSPTAGGVAGRGTKGLDEAVMKTFPVFVYSAVKELKIGKGALECAVCLNEFEDEETLRLLPKCDHVFHSECVDAWLASHVTCPVCRANLIPEEGSSGGQTVGESSDHHNEDTQMSETEATRESQFPTAGGEDEINVFSSRTSMLGKLPRSHTTGHMIVQPQGEDHERFTLRLPEDVRDQIVNGTLNRTISFPATHEGGRSSRRGYRSGSMNERTSRGRANRFWQMDTNASSEGWVFTMAPPFVLRTGSTKSTKMEGEGSRSLKFLTSVKSLKSSMNCSSSSNADGVEQPVLRRPPV